MWNQVSSWGTACSGASNQYFVYLGTSNPPNYYTTVASDVTSLNVNDLTRGATYYWQILASNGETYTASEVRSFTILDDQIVGRDGTPSLPIFDDQPLKLRHLNDSGHARFMGVVEILVPCDQIIRSGG